MAAEHALVFDEPPPLRRDSPRPKSGALPRGRSRWADHVAPDSHRAHGTYVKYVVEHCHCEPCRQANREYERRRVHAIARPDEVWMPYVPAHRARKHIQALAGEGVGIKTIAKLSGVPHGSLTKIIYGDRKRGMKPSKRIRPATEARILAVTAVGATGAQKIPAGPTWLLLDDLIARGWTRSWIATQLLGRPTPSLQVSRDRVRAATARKVEELHRRCEGKVGPRRRSRWQS